MTEAPRRPVALLVATGLAFLMLMALGLWQVQRLGWKTQLIARVDARVAAQPAPAPGPANWSELTPEADEYRRVLASGRYAADRDVLVQAVTDQGPGFWVITPMTTDQGWALLVNRGFVPADRRDDRPVPPGPQSVTGLLRMSQPDGAFLRSNDPATGRWYSRDTRAIGTALGLPVVAPYFVDAQQAGDGLPMGGLTVVSFRNHHLSYALTWFAMAAGVVALTVLALRR